MAHDIFISYSTKDKLTADAACAVLEAAGIRCWIAPRDIFAGAEWGDSIIQAITNCRAMVLVFSSNANGSPQIRREVERVVSKGVPVIPLRIEDIAPTHSLEYFIGTVHWLDALTPPLEDHLHKLTHTIKALLNSGVDPPKIPDPVPTPRPLPPAPPPSPRKAPPWIAIAVAAAIVVAGAAWWLFSRGASSPGIQTPAAFAPSTPTAEVPTPAAPTPPPPNEPQPLAAAPRTAPVVDPGVVGTLEYSALIDDMEWHFVNTIAAQGTYQLLETQQESGTYQAAQGHYRTMAVKTGRVAEGTYMTVGADSFQITSSTGSITYKAQKPIPPLDPTNPVLVGVWQSTVLVNAQPWMVTLQINPDGTYSFKARAKDHGTIRMTNGLWQATSALTGQSTPGSYRIVSTHAVELTSSAGTAVWQRK